MFLLSGQVNKQTNKKKWSVRMWQSPVRWFHLTLKTQTHTPEKSKIDNMSTYYQPIIGCTVLHIVCLWPWLHLMPVQVPVFYELKFSFYQLLYQSYHCHSLDHEVSSTGVDANPFLSLKMYCTLLYTISYSFSWYYTRLYTGTAWSRSHDSSL